MRPLRRLTGPKKVKRVSLVQFIEVPSVLHAGTGNIFPLQQYLPIIHVLCNPGLRKRHWDKMNEVVGYNITPDSGTSLRKMLKHQLEPFLDQFEVISTSASKEHSLEKAMQKMEDDWDTVLFNTILYRDTG